MAVKVKTRIAPTPSGFLHIGNIFSFILTWLYAKKNNGTLLLRIDDLDKARVRKEYIDDIFRTLDWLNIDYDEGPSGTEDFLKNYSQHTRLDLYNDYLKRLKEDGFLFVCKCSRTQVKANSKDGQYAGTCLHQSISSFTNIAWRLLHAQDFLVSFKDVLHGKVTCDLWQQMRYPVLKRKDGLPAYQIASLADDCQYDINTLVRGNDLINSTAVQIHLAKLLKLNNFEESTFLHHPILLDIDKRHKLSKSQEAPAVHLWRNKPDGKTVLLRKIARLLYIDPDNIEHTEDLLQEFQTHKLRSMK